MDIAQYIRFRFRDRSGNIVNTTDANGVAMGTFMYFSNLEVKGLVIEAQRGLNTILTTHSGNVASVPSIQPRRFDFTINTDNAATFHKLSKLNDYIRLGYRVEFWLLEGNFAYNSVTDDLFDTASATVFPFAHVQYRGNEATHNRLFRGMGLRKQTDTELSVYEGSLLAIPAQPTAGNPQDNDGPLGQN